MEKKVKIDIPIYFGYLIIVFSDDLKAVSDKYKLGLEEQNYPAFVVGDKDLSGVNQYWMVFNPKYICHTIIAHEVVHCANWLFFDISAKPDLINDEPYAYLVGWITGQIYKYAEKNGININ